MPHCIIEYSAPLCEITPAATLIDAVYRAACDSDLFDNSHIRVRATAYHDYIAGYAADNFIHVTLRILSGRSQQQKSRLTDSVRERLCGLGLSSVSVSVDIRDIDRETYARTVIPAGSLS